MVLLMQGPASILMVITARRALWLVTQRCIPMCHSRLAFSKELIGKIYLGGRVLGVFAPASLLEVGNESSEHTCPHSARCWHCCLVSVPELLA